MKKSPILPPLLLLTLAATGCQSTEGDATAAADYDPAAAMAQMMEWGQPAEHHRHLDPIVGDFQAELEMWMEPGGEGQASSGRMTNRWVMGGRFLQGEFEGDFGGMPFEGLSLFGYDNATGEYVGFWIDSISTMMMPISHGSISADGKIITMDRELFDPTRGAEVHQRDVMTIESDDVHTYEMYSTTPEGDEFLTMRATYTRI